MAKTILLVDDDRDDSELFGEALKFVDESIQYHRAVNGKDAFKVLEEIDKPDVIFLDINMPVVNGWECLTELKKDVKHKDIPVIMYSTSSHEREVKIAEDLGAIHFVSKPHDFKDLKKMLSNVVSKLSQGPLSRATFPK